MQSGKLRHRVTFQSGSTAVNDFGEPTPVYSNIDTVWARVEPIAGKERYAALHTQGEVDYIITCIYQDALSTLSIDDRAIWGSVTFDVKSVINRDERNRELQVFARRHI